MPPSQCAIEWLFNVYVCRYLQFSIRVGSGSSVGSCPTPDADNELVIVQFTCNGGIDWHLLQLIEVSDKYTQPMYVHLMFCTANPIQWHGSELDCLIIVFLLQFVVISHFSCFNFVIVVK